MMIMREFVKHIMAIYPGSCRDDVYKMIQIVFRGLRSAISSGETVCIPGLGILFPVYIEQKGKKWKTPQGDIVDLQDKIKVRFRPSKRFEKHLTELFMDGQLVEIKHAEAEETEESLEEQMGSL